ncbi:MAG: hypothetical protein M1814_006530 [Vezdaea aestivalis]|nr:MAG: hypothetical protein M1814_006530 [Vezdaea aestivalis]
MSGAFRGSPILSGGLLWKRPWRMSTPQKARHRERLKKVDKVISVVDKALEKAGMSIKQIEKWKTDMPAEHEMYPRDKYTVFDRKEKGYRKGIHKVPKWTRVTQRRNPPGY